MQKQLRKAVKTKRPGKLTKGVLFHQDNASAHKSVGAMAAVHDLSTTLSTAPSYYYFLFPNTKKHLAGRHYRSDEDVIAALKECFRDQDEGFDSTGIQGLQLEEVYGPKERLC